MRAFAGPDNPNGTDIGNAAFNIANDPGTPGTNFNQVAAGSSPFIAGSSPGIGNLAANLGGTSNPTSNAQVNAVGQFNFATNLAGTGNFVQAGDGAGLVNSNPALFASAISINGTNNQVTATGGPLAVAGALGTVATPVTQIGPGVNIK